MTRPFTIIDAPQRSEAWFQARLGRLTSSRAADMCSARKDKTEAAGRRNLRVQLALERITGRPQEHGYGYQSFAMQQGCDREAEAVGWYEALTGRLIAPTGFLRHDTLMVGCSLDGHIGDFEGIVEIKSPIPATHLDYWTTNVVPDEYLKQITHALWISGAQWCDWLSFNPDFPEPMHVKLTRVRRGDVDIAGYERKALAFLADVERDVNIIRTQANLPAVLEASA